MLFNLLRVYKQNNQVFLTYYGNILMLFKATKVYTLSHTFSSDIFSGSSEHTNHLAVNGSGMVKLK